MSDIPQDEIPTIVTDGFDDYDMGPERSEYSGRIGASDIPSQDAIPHLKKDEAHLTKLFGTLDAEKWTSIGVQLRLSTDIHGGAADMVTDMMKEVVYQMKARYNNLSAQDQGIVIQANKRVREEVIHVLPSGAKMAILEALTDMLHFDTLEDAKKLTAALAAKLEEQWQ